MAPDNTAGSADLAQAADQQAPSDAVAAEAQPSDDGAGRIAAVARVAEGTAAIRAPRTGSGGDAAPAEAPQGEAPPAESAPVPDESIAALVTQGDVPDVNLPPAPVQPMAPMAPDQSFLPETPTPTTDGTPTPESDGQSAAPQLAEDTSGQLGVTALAPDTTSDTTVSDDQGKRRDKRDKSGKDGGTAEQEQSAVMIGRLWAGLRGPLIRPGR